MTKTTDAGRAKIAPRLRIGAASARWIDDMDRHVRACDIRGPIDSFRDVAADPIDGHASRSDLDDLIRRRLLRVVHYGFDDSMGRDPCRDMQPDTCGSSWTVEPTPKLIRALWPDRLHEAPGARAALALAEGR